jgi:tetratricopeptide (TPR) repeat protein
MRAWMHDTMDWWGFERSSWRREQVQRDADMALRLAPGLAEAHTAKAMQLYHGSLDYEGAIRELEIARTLAPGDAQPLFWLGVIYRRQDRWDEAVASLGRVATLDPLNAGLLIDYGGTLQAVRRVADAVRIFDRIAAIDGSPGSRVDPAYARFLLSGDAEALARTLGELQLKSGQGCFVMALRAGAFGSLGRHDEAVGALEQCRQPSFVQPYYNERIPTDHFIALAKWHKDRSRTPPEAATARAMMEEALAANPDRSHLRMFLAMNLVMHGDKERALAEVERALKDTPRSRDALVATTLLAQAAEVHANTGQLDRAFAELEESLARPVGTFVAEITVNPDFAPLRSDPRDEKLLAGKPLKGGA